METKKKLRLPLILMLILGLVCLISCAMVGWQWYDSTVDRSGWEMQHERYFYRDFHNHRVKGWQDIDGSRYYFNDKGAMETGWLPLEAETYYLDTDGTVYTGWLTDQGKRYYFDEANDGAMTQGLLFDGDDLYLLGEDGHMLTGLQLAQGNTYYFSEDGTAATGTVSIREEQYLFGEDFTLQTGWQNWDGEVYYYLPEGPMAKGIHKIDGKLYCFGNDGIRQQGWVTQGEYSYYFGEDGAAYTGPHTIDGRKHYFTPNGIHIVLVNASNPIPDYYKPDVVTLFGWNQCSRICQEPLKRMLHDCEASGHPYTFNSAYRSHENQEQIVELRTQEYMSKGMTYEEAYKKTLESAAYPGTSEHEMGLAADIWGKEANEWLAEHCWEYGFILRYPPDKADITSIQFEPWHFRYVGTDVSMDMKDSGQCLEEYLGAGPAEKK